ncbi:sigma-70 family RNA polymerase sigma factor [Pendulispora rubella]|uniref:RNA polymerase sigma factor SigS n=1 Tax=Pendulispora rubella TaxID=2741070 RepID=A0ABZ2L7L3_9BACT
MEIRSNEEWLVALRGPSPQGDGVREELRRRLLRGLAHGLASRALDEATLEDMAQNALLRVLDRLADFRGESRFTTWAMAVAMRVALSELRRAHWREVSLEAVAPDDAWNLPGYDEPVATAEQSMAQRHALEVLERATQERLTPRQRQVIAGELRGMPQEEIALQLGIGRNALYKLGHDARRALLRALLDAGLSADDVRWAFESER